MKISMHTIAFKTQTHPNHRFQNLYGLLDSDLFVQSWGQINKQSGCGIDDVTPSEFKQRLPEHIDRLHQELKCKSYRANDVKRVFIAKSNDKLRPLGLLALDDKIVQQGVICNGLIKLARV